MSKGGATWINSYGKTHYEDNKSYYINKAKIRSDKVKRFIRLVKVTNPFCVSCGLKFPYYVLDFDHVHGKKLFNVSQGWQYGMNKLKIEMKKCELVCANCHRIRTWIRNNRN